MFKVGHRLPNADTSPWMESPGIVSGCKVTAGPGLYLNVGPGKLCFANGRSAEILFDMEKVARVVPDPQASRMDYLVCDVRGDDLIFRIIRGIHTENSKAHFPVTLKDGVLLSKLFIKYPCLGPEAVFVYNAIPQRGEASAIACGVLDYPDGIRSVFRTEILTGTDFSLNVVVGGVPQDQFIDYNLNTWIDEAGEERTSINFVEPPGPGVSIHLKAYTGNMRLVP